MNFNKHLVMCCILYITNHCLTEGAEECVQRRLGACKVLERLNSLEEFHSPQPEGFALKTSMEINLLDNKHSFENNLPVERKRPIAYNLDNAAVVTISILMDIGYFDINLGKKYYRLAELYYKIYGTDFGETKYNRYTPSLPTFPYILHLEITTRNVAINYLPPADGTFSVYADANTEPFLEYQLTEDFNVQYIGLDATGNQTDIIAFVDCSLEDKPNCGSHRVERLYGCRYAVISTAIINNFEAFQKAYGKDVLFDEFIIVETEYTSRIDFVFQDHLLGIDFKSDSIEAQLLRLNILKSVRTKQWFDVPASPYAVRVLLTTGENNSYLNISNLQSQEILSLNLCVNVGSLDYIRFDGPKLYFDCLNYDEFDSDEVESIMMNDRPRKIKGFAEQLFVYHEYGYNYTKTLLDTRDFVSEPFVMYHHEFGNSTQDWCAGEVKPKVLVTSKYDNDSVQAVIEISNAAVLTELKEINAQNKAIADANTANVGVNTAVLTSVLTELEKISNVSVDTNKANEAILFELRSVKASIDALATHLKQNTTVNNN